MVDSGGVHVAHTHYTQQENGHWGRERGVQLSMNHPIHQQSLTNRLMYAENLNMLVRVVCRLSAYIKRFVSDILLYVIE